MTAQLVTLILDRFDGAENAYVKGTATFTPSLEFPDTADQMLIGQAPVTATFRAGSLPQVIVIANDTAGPQGDSSPGWTWNVTYSGVPGDPAPASYYILSTNGDTQRLSSLASVPAAQPGQQYVPLPDTPPSSASQVLGLSSDSPLVTEWVDQSGGGGGGSGTVTTVSVATANGFAGTVANATTTPAITVKTTVTGLLKGNGTAVSAASAGTDYLAPTGSGAALTGITAAQVGAASTGALAAEVSRAEAAEALLAPLASPALTGTPTAPTATPGTDDTQLATTAYADAAVAVETSRAETAEALKAPLASPALTGNPTAPTQSAGNNSTRLATTAYADAAVGVETGRAETAEALLIPLTQKGANSGVATLDSGGHVPTGQIPTLNQNTTGNAATATNLAGGATLPDYLAPKAVTLSFVGSGTTLVDASAGNAFNLTLTASTTTLGNPSNPVDGEVIRFRITQGSGGSFTLSYGTAYDFGTAGAPTLSTSAGKVDILGFEYVSSISKWCCLGSGLGF